MSSVASRYIYSSDHFTVKARIFEIDGQTWIHLNRFEGCTQNPPLEARHYKDELDRVREFGPTGSLLSVEWVLEPDWYHRVVHWHAWIPLDWQDSECPWYHKFNQSVSPEMVQSGPLSKYKLSDQWIKTARADIRDIHECCRAIRERTPYPNMGSLPAHFSFERLYDLFESERDAEIVAADARRAALDGLGFLGWWCHSQPEWDDKLPADVIARIQARHPVGRKKRGVLFDIHRDWQEMNLPLLVREDVPVFYAWTIVEATNPRFSRLSPLFLRDYEAARLSRGGTLVHLEDLRNYDKLKAVDRFDEFLQNGSEDFKPDEDSLPQSIGKRTPAFIKDFQNWKPRPILTKAERSYCANSFHRAVYRDEGEYRLHYWRYRLKNPHGSTSQFTAMDVDVDEDESDYGDDEDDVSWPPSGHVVPSAVRELYKVEFAPNPGCILPTDAFRPIAVVTPHMLSSLSILAVRAAKEIMAKGSSNLLLEPGMEVDPPVIIQESAPPIAPTRPSKDNRRRRKEKRREFSSTSTDYAAERREQQRSGRMAPDQRDYRTDHPDMSKGWYVHDSGSEDFYHPSSQEDAPYLGRREGLPVPQFRVTDMDKARGRPRASDWVKAMSQPTHLRDRISIRHAPRSPASTTGAGQRANHHQMLVATPNGELQRFVENFERWGARLTYAAIVNEVPSTLRWDESYIRMGVLYVPELRDEVRMRYFANTVPGIQSITQVLNIAIAHGLSFNIAIPPTNLAFFAPKTLTSAEAAAGVFYDEYNEPELVWGNGGAEFWSRWIVRARDILNRPHGRAAIFAGGPLAWIARRLCGDEILARAMKGPSVQSTVYFAGFVDTDSQLLHRHDKLSKSEVLVLYGFLPSKTRGQHDEWMFPSPYVLEQTLEEWSGEVTPLLDHIMTDLWNKFSKGSVTTRTVGAWKGYLRGNNHGIRSLAILPSDADWIEGKTRLEAVFSKSWHRAYLEDLQVPEPYKSITNGL